MLDQFLREEASPQVRAKLREATSAVMSGEPPGRRVLNFNRFDVTLEADTGAATIEDVLDTSSAGKLVLPLLSLLDVLSP